MISDDRMAAYGLGPRLDTRSLAANPWVAAIDDDLTALLANWPLARSISFVMTESLQSRAVARLDDRCVVFTFGLVDEICKLAAAIVGQGAFVAFGDTKPNWRPSFDHPRHIVHQMDARPFQWTPDTVSGLADYERQVIFMHLVQSLSRFILFHEVAHIVHGHGRSDDLEMGLALEMADGHDVPPPSCFIAVESQAKELAADTFALEALVHWLKTHFGRADPNETHQLLRARLLPDLRAQVRWALISSYLVFRLLDRQDHTPQSARKATHPPPAFRLKYLFGHAVELNLAELSEAELEAEIRAIIAETDAVLAIAFDRPPEPDWLGTVGGQGYDEIFHAIYRAVPDWRR